MARRRVLAILAAGVLTVFGTVVLLVYVSSADRRAQQGAQLVEVLIATEQIDGGVAPADMGELVAPRSIPLDLRQSDAVTDLGNASLDGKVTTETILEGEQIVARQFGSAAQAKGAAGQIPEGKEIMTVALEPQRAVGGKLRAGDLVGVMLAFDGEEGSDGAAPDRRATTAMVRTGIKVTEIVGGRDRETGAVGDTVLVSLEVDQTDAETIAFGQQYGSVWLTQQPESPLAADSDVRTRENVLDTGPSG